MEIKMYYEDTDAGGIIYYANHVKYMERGRTEYLNTLGISLPRLMEQGSLFTVTDLELHYRSFAQYGDVLIVESRLKELAAAFLIIEHRMKEKNSGRLVAEGNTKLVCVSIRGKAKRIPRDMYTTLQAERQQAHRESEKMR
jgi:acyl-CoA thioester hydrolase